MAGAEHIICIIQARMGSVRFPAKVLSPILGKPMILHQVERLKRCKQISDIVVATSTDPQDDDLCRTLDNASVSYFRGNLKDVLDRIYRAAIEYKADVVVRSTADCPLIDPGIVDETIAYFRSDNYDYVSNCLEPTFPDGLDVEVMSMNALSSAWKEAQQESEREHVTPYIRTHPDLFMIGSIKNDEDMSSYRWTVDEPQDLELVKRIYETLHPENPAFATTEIIALLDASPSLLSLNNNVPRDEGYRKSIIQQRYKKSNEFYNKVSSIIPLGSQTFSKSKTQFPQGVSPLFIDRAEGCRVWDIDGNEYLDFNSSLGAINLSYTDPDVIAAVRNQLEKGTIYPLPHTLEYEVAEKLTQFIPCAEMVRFGKNGSDVTTGAIRLARAYTAREDILAIGYHGWHDWYIGSTSMNRGVPDYTKTLTHKIPYNDFDALETFFKEHGEKLAAVIMEPMNRDFPKNGYLERISALCKLYGSIFIFDEMITGFRYSRGGAQEVLGVTPDLATFGKGIANGYPLSAIVGRKDIMALMEEVFFSFTFGGETLSLAACLATLKKLEDGSIINAIQRKGQTIKSSVEALIVNHNLQDVVNIFGHPSWTILDFTDCSGYSGWQIRTLYLQEAFAKGILCIGSHFPTHAHTEQDVRTLLKTYDEIFALIRLAIETRSLEQRLHAKPLVPLFKVR